MGAKGRCARWAGVCMVVLGVATARAAEPIRLEELGDGPVPITGIGNAELSGITWTGRSHYFAVDDGGPRLVPLEVTTDDASGAITSVVAGDLVALKGAHDLEGIAWRIAERSVLVTDEVTHEIREYDPDNGQLQRSVPAPPRFAGRIRKNLGFEGIAVAPDGKSAWIANEAPLRLDDSPSGALEGEWVRLQRLDASLSGAGQWAYRTEPGLGMVGVVDLMVAPEGVLFVLERALTGGGLSARIFAVELAAATDVTKLERLGERNGFVPARKQKLWERTGGFQNFEGMAVGPALASGGRLVLLVSDGGGQRPPTLLPLRLSISSAPGAP